MTLRDYALYCERNLIERFFLKIKHFRRIATRYEQTPRAFLSMLEQMENAHVALPIRQRMSERDPLIDVRAHDFEGPVGHSHAV